MYLNNILNSRSEQAFGGPLDAKPGTPHTEGKCQMKNVRQYNIVSFIIFARTKTLNFITFESLTLLCLARDE